ncbi:hypothetical protein PRIC2_002662 [Phytophthora ramorum]
MATTHEGQETTIELSGIGTGLDDRMLMNMYRTYGPIMRVTHSGSNSAQVVFAQKNHARKAVEATNGAVVYGKTLKVRIQRQFKNANQPCRGFAAGICRKGDMCKYQHVTDSAQFAPPTASPTVQKAKREPKKKAPRNAPGPAEVSPEIQAIPGLPKPDTAASTEKANRPCLFFQSGVCTRGDACRFVHVPKASAAPVMAAVQNVPAKNAPAKDAPVKKAPAKKIVAKAKISGDESKAELEQNDEPRACVECEKPGVAVWKCAKCDNSLYCDDCNSAVHRARVMAKHKRSKLPPVPKLPRCGECESKTANVRCEQCEVPFCASCDASVHKFKSLRKHVRVTLSAKSEKAKPKVKEEPKPATKEQKKKQAEEPAPLPKVANHVSYVESVPQLAFSSESESEDEDMPEASTVQPRDDNDEPMSTAAGASDTETDDDFDDAKPRSSASVPDTPTPVVKEQTSESESDEDFDDKPTVKPTPVPASVPTTELSSDSDSSDDEAPEPTQNANPAPKMELSSDSESDDEEDEDPPKPAPTSKPTLAELSSESEADSDDEAPSKSAVKSTLKPASKVKSTLKPASKVKSTLKPASKPVAKPTPAPKVATKKTPSKSSSSDSSSSDSSDSEDEAPPTKPAAKPTPAPRRAPAPVRNNRAAGISEGSSHTLVKKIEAFNVSGEDHEMHLASNLNGFERLLAHDCAERLGLAHESTGDGLERHIIISRHGSKRPAADSSIGHKAKKSKHH